MIWIGRWGYFAESINPAFGTDKNAVLFSGSETAGNYTEYTGTFTDAVLEGNGTYTVALTDADFAGEVSISQLHVATDIPMNDQIKFTDVKVKVNNKTVLKFDEGYMETDNKYNEGGMVLLTINHWRKPLEEIVMGNGMAVSGNGAECLTGSGKDNIEITFTVSGFAYDKVEPTAAAVSAAPTAAASDTADTAAAQTTADASGQTNEGTAGVPYILIIAGSAVAVILIAILVFLKMKKHS
jgi:hypothetical protein